MHKLLLIFLSLFSFNIYVLADEVQDPFEEINQVTFAVNEALDNTIAKPIAIVYGDITPPFIQNRVTRFFKNLAEIDTFINQALQGKPRLAFQDFGRFTINSTIGLLGLFDVATRMGLEAHDEDFGQTLAVWGVPSGPYIMLPIIGPSNARDLMSRPISSFLSGTFAMTDTDVKLALTALDVIETRERYLDFEAIIQGDRSDSEVSELISNIANDIKEDGVLTNADLGAKLLSHARYLKPDEIRINLEDKYKKLNEDITIPAFEPILEKFTLNSSFEKNDNQHKLFFEEDIHLTTLGHRAIATSIVSHLRNK